MASIATDDARAVLVGRAAFVGGFLLSLVVWLQCQPPVNTFATVVSLDSIKRPPVIVPMDLYAEPQPPGLIKQLVDSLTATLPDDVQAGHWLVAPPVHTDAQAWPRGMVIHPPAFPDRIAADIPTTLDRVLSALLSPWLTTAS